MGHTVMRQKLAEFDQPAAQMRLKIGESTPVKQQFDTTWEFLNNEATLRFEDLDAKWAPRFLEFFQAQFASVAHRNGD